MYEVIIPETDNYTQEWVTMVSKEIVTIHVFRSMRDHRLAGNPVSYPTVDQARIMREDTEKGVWAEVARRKRNKAAAEARRAKEQLVVHDVVREEAVVNDVDQVNERQAGESTGQVEAAITSPAVLAMTEGTVEVSATAESDECQDDEIVKAMEDIELDATAGDEEQIAVLSSEIREAIPLHDRLLKEHGEEDPARDELLCGIGDDGVIAVVAASSAYAQAVSGLHYEKPVTDVDGHDTSDSSGYIASTDPRLKEALSRAMKPWRDRADVTLLHGSEQFRDVISSIRAYVKPVWYNGRVLGIALLGHSSAFLPTRVAKIKGAHPMGLRPHGCTDAALVQDVGLQMRRYPRMRVDFTYSRRAQPRQERVMVVIPCGRLLTPVGPYNYFGTENAWYVDGVFPPSAAGSPVVSLEDGAVVAQLGDDQLPVDTRTPRTRVLNVWSEVEETSDDGYFDCDVCGFNVRRYLHETRCDVQAPNDETVKSIARRRAWLGDIVFHRIVRYALLQAGVPDKLLQHKASYYSSASYQKMLYLEYGGVRWPMRGSSEHSYSTAFEATVVDDLNIVMFVMDRLSKELRVELTADPVVFMPSDQELDAIGYVFVDAAEYQREDSQ